MTTLTIELPDQAMQHGLRVRAERNGRSAEAEVRAILAEVVLPVEQPKLSQQLAAIGRKYALTKEECEQLSVRERYYPEPPDLEGEP